MHSKEIKFSYSSSHSEELSDSEHRNTEFHHFREKKSFILAAIWEH